MTTAEIEADALRDIAEQSHAWPFEEARKIVARLKRKANDEVIFERPGMREFRQFSERRGGCFNRRHDALTGQ